MNTLDALLVLLTVSYGLSGYWRGFLTGATATAGLLAGGALGIALAPRLLQSAQPSVGVSLAALVLVLLAASLGQAFGAFLGSRLRARITWRPARTLDAVGGAVLSMAAALCIAWALGYAASQARLPLVTEEVRSSAVLSRVDRMLPDAAANVLGEFNQVVDSGFFPPYLEPFSPEPIPPVQRPDSRVLRQPAVVDAQASVVKVLGNALECARTVEGSGFVYAPGRVMTNAHVVAGVDEPVVVTADGTLDAAVVLFDADLDVAVLAVPGLTAPPLRFDRDGAAGASAAVLGYPENGPYSAQPARIRAEQRLRSPDIYSSGAVTREVFSLRADVRSGNSGGPLVSPTGEVYGVVFAASLTDTSTAYALTADQVNGDARAGRGAAEEVSTGGCA